MIEFLAVVCALTFIIFTGTCIWVLISLAKMDREYNRQQGKRNAGE
jgi:hypothetical protein